MGETSGIGVNQKGFVRAESLFEHDSPRRMTDHTRRMISRNGKDCLCKKMKRQKKLKKRRDLYVYVASSSFQVKIHSTNCGEPEESGGGR